MLELYHAGLTTCSKKVRLCLAEKALCYTSHYVDLRKFEHHRPEYLALNPNGVVPTLVDGGRPILESMIINEYLDDAYPETPLRPSTAVGRAQMRQWTKLANDLGLVAVVPATWQHYTPLLAGMDDRELQAVLDRVPTRERREQWRKAATASFGADDHGRARAAAERIVAAVESGSGGGPWLMGTQYTLADIDLLPYVDRIATFFPDLVDTSGGAAPASKTRAWLDRMRARPAVMATYRPSADAPASVVPVTVA